MKIAVIKYNSGNIRSVFHALRRLDVDPIWTDDAEEIASADGVIFPGVGEASTAMNYLSARGLDKILCSLTQPVLGICLGLQLMCRSSEENDTSCLGLFDCEVKKFPSGTEKIPHIGWNLLRDTTSDLLRDLPERAYVYFVHSYYASYLSGSTVATTDYIVPFSAALQRDNFYGVQFHPEKSAEVGQQILKNFLSIVQNHGAL